MRKRSSLNTEKVFFLPEELLIEILTLLEAKDLLRVKCVCKVWYSIIRSKHLVDMHAMRTGLWICNFEHRGESLTSERIQEEIIYLHHSRGVFLEKRVFLPPAMPSPIYCNFEHRGESLTSERIQENIIYLHHCRGFFLEKRVFLLPAMPSPIYQIRNPTTRRILDLPQPHERLIKMFIFLSPSTSSYYVVSIYFDNKKKKVNLELLDLGGQSNDACPNADLSWRTLKISLFDKVSRQERCHFLYCMSCEGILYVLTALKVGLSNPKLLCVDLVKQTCKILNVPQSFYFYCKELRFQSWKDKPSVLFVREEKLNVWVLEDYKKEKWADTMVIPLPYLEQNPNLKEWVPLIHHDDGDEKDIVICLMERCFISERGSKSVCFVNKHGSKSVCFVPSPRTRVPATLVSLKGMHATG